MHTTDAHKWSCAKVAISFEGGGHGGLVVRTSMPQLKRHPLEVQIRGKRLRRAHWRSRRPWYERVVERRPNPTRN